MGGSTGAGGGGGMTGGMTGTGGSHPMGGVAGHLPPPAGTGGTTGAAGSGNMGGSGGAMVDPRCAAVDGAVSWWHADGDFDDAIGSNDGLTAGQVSFMAGIDQQAFSFNGNTGSFIQVPDDPSLQMTTGMTIDAWINQPVLGGRIVDKITAFSNDGYILDMFGANVRLIIGGNDMTSADQVPAGIWTHVAATYSSDGHMAIYINGAPSGEKMISPGAIPTNNLALRMGADSDGGSLFIGGLDEPRMFNRALSAAEIATLFWQTSNCQ
jgi:hypothetical protein